MVIRPCHPTNTEPSAGGQSATGDENPAHKKILDVEGNPLVKLSRNIATVHPDVIGLVSLAIQGGEKKVGNIMMMSTQVGRGRTGW